MKDIRWLRTARAKHKGAMVVECTGDYHPIPSAIRHKMGSRHLPDASFVSSSAIGIVYIRDAEYDVLEPAVTSAANTVVVSELEETRGRPYDPTLRGSL